MLSIEAERHAQALRVLLQSGRLAECRLGGSPEDGSRGLERLVADLLAELAMLTVEEQHGTKIDDATWRVAGHNVAGLHQLILALVHE